jgi:hypothetical protein
MFITSFFLSFCPFSFIPLLSFSHILLFFFASLLHWSGDGWSSSRYATSRRAVVWASPPRPSPATPQERPRALSRYGRAHLPALRALRGRKAASLGELAAPPSSELAAPRSRPRSSSRHRRRTSELAAGAPSSCSAPPIALLVSGANWTRQARAQESVREQGWALGLDSDPDPLPRRPDPRVRSPLGRIKARTATVQTSVASVPTLSACDAG